VTSDRIEAQQNPIPDINALIDCIATEIRAKLNLHTNTERILLFGFPSSVRCATIREASMAKCVVLFGSPLSIVISS